MKYYDRKDSAMPKPVSLICIDRKDLNETQMKILNYFVWKHFKGQTVNPEIEEIAREQRKTMQQILDINNKNRKQIGHHITSLSEINRVINYNNKNLKKLRYDIVELAKKGAKYNIFEVTEEKLKITNVGAMTYLDFANVQTGRGETVTYTLGAAFQYHLERMKNDSASERYVWLDFDIINNFKSKYALALYELIKTRNNGFNIGKIEINPAFREFFGIPMKSYKNTAVLKRDVFCVAAKKYEQATGDKVEFEITKEGKKRFVRFKIEYKDKEERELFLFIAKKMNAKNPEAYAKKLIEDYASNSSTLDLDKWQKELISEKKRIQENKEKEEKKNQKIAQRKNQFKTIIKKFETTIY